MVAAGRCRVGAAGRVASALKWSGWAIGVPAAVAAVAALPVSQLRARFKLDDERDDAGGGGGHRAQPDGPVATSTGPGLAQLRVHAAQVRVPYIERDAQQQVAEAIGPGRAVLLVGHSMAGKTRLAAQVVQHRFPDAPLLVPESGKALRELMDKGLDPRRGRGVAG